MVLVTVVEADISDSAGKFWDGNCQSDDQCVPVSHCLEKGNLSVENIHLTSNDVFSKDVSAQMVVLFNFGTLPPLYLLLPL